MKKLNDRAAIFIVPPPPITMATQTAMVTRWTDEDYEEHCAKTVVVVDPCDEYEKYCADYQMHCEQLMAEYERDCDQEIAEYKRQCEEDERNQPWCSDCHPQSGCDGDHGDEMRAGCFIRKGPAFSAADITAAAAAAEKAKEMAASASSYAEEVDVWARNLERLIKESKELREASLSSFYKEEEEEEECLWDIEAV